MTTDTQTIEQTPLDKELAGLNDERKKIEFKHEILGKLTGLAKDKIKSVFVTELYGAKAWLSFGSDSYYDYQYKPQLKLTFEDLTELDRKFPPVDMAMVRDGCLSFRPQSYVDSLPDSKKERWDKVTKVAGIMVDLTLFQGPRMTIEWTSEMEGIGLVRIKCLFREIPASFGRIDMKVKRYSDGEIRTIESCTWIRNSSSPLAGYQQQVRWASGDHKTPNNFTVYWTDDLEMAELVAVLKGE